MMHFTINFRVYSMCISELYTMYVCVSAHHSSLKDTRLSSYLVVRVDLLLTYLWNVIIFVYQMC